MRAQMMPEPYRTRISRDLRAYIDLHVIGNDTLKNARELARSHESAQRLQYCMWREVVAVAKVCDSEITSLFVDSLNESINLYSSRIAHAYARVPALILWLLLCISMVSVALVGYGFGVSGQRSWGMMILVAAVLAAILVMIADLDDPSSGRITTSQQSILDLREGLSGFETPGR